MERAVRKHSRWADNGPMVHFTRHKNLSCYWRHASTAHDQLGYQIGHGSDINAFQNWISRLNKKVILERIRSWDFNKVLKFVRHGGGVDSSSMYIGNPIKLIITLRKVEFFSGGESRLSMDELLDLGNNDVSQKESDKEIPHLHSLVEPHPESVQHIRLSTNNT